jgi:hypothetical protein
MLHRQTRMIAMTRIENIAMLAALFGTQFLFVGTLLMG